MKSELIICTKNRVGELEKCLESIQKQVVIPARILIVDASNNNETEKLTEKYSISLPLVYSKSHPHLARQRNYGVEHLLPKTDIVHFIDDDVILDEMYFAAIERIIIQDVSGRIGGVAGLIMNNNKQKPTIPRRIFFLDSKRRGAILPSFKNTDVFDAQTEMQVDWLRGCSSYRKKIFSEFQFDSNLRDYSLGEDVDFSFRVSRKYLLIVTPKAKLIHLKSSTERQSYLNWHRSEVLHRYYYVKKNLKKKRYIYAFWWSILGWIMINGTKTFTKISRWYFKNTIGIILGVFDIITKNHYLLGKQTHE